MNLSPKTQGYLRSLDSFKHETVSQLFFAFLLALSNSFAQVQRQVQQILGGLLFHQ